MNCKFCQAELEEGNPVCPACGKNNDAEQDACSQTLESESAEETAVMAEASESTSGNEGEISAPEGTPEEASEEPENTAGDEGEPPVTEESEEMPGEASEEPEKPKKKTWKIVTAVVGCAALLLALAAAIFYGVNGSFQPKANDVKYKDSYTVEDEQALKASGKVVATIGEKELTNGQLQIFYWMQVYNFLDYYGGYAPYFGLDYTQPLDAQVNSTVDETWQQYFLDGALQNWQRYQVLGILAEKNGFQLDEELQSDLDTMPEALNQMAQESGFESAEAMLQSEMGPGCTLEDYMRYMELYYRGYQFFASEYDKLNPTDEEIEAYFAEHEADFAESGVTKDSGPMVDVRHILIMPQGGATAEDGTTTYSEEEWEACRASAQAILDEWLDGEATEDSFAALANAYSEDGGSNTNGGLYTNVTQSTSFVEPFKEWCLDESRRVGDYGLVQTTYGYHVMYLSGSRQTWYAYAQSSLLTELSNQMLNNAMEEYPMNVKYKNIVIGEVNLAG